MALYAFLVSMKNTSPVSFRQGKFLKWAEVLGKAINNPLFHWSHLELKKYFGYNGVLNKKTAEEVWELCNKRLAEKICLSARSSDSPTLL